jgi:hypothetical protein
MSLCSYTLWKTPNPHKELAKSFVELYYKLLEKLPPEMAGCLLYGTLAGEE